MLVTRFDPFREFGQLRRGFNYLHAAMDDAKKSKHHTVFDFKPTVSTREADDAYYVDVDLPGVRKEDIAISLHDNVLTISGKREMNSEDKESDYYKIESRYGAFERSFSLPEDVDEQQIEAASHDGVLQISLAKSAVLEKTPKTIDIK